MRADDTQEVRALLRAACAGHGNQLAFAKRHGISQPYVSAVILGKCTPCRRMYEALGLLPTYEDRITGLPPVQQALLDSGRYCMPGE